MHIHHLPIQQQLDARMEIAAVGVPASAARQKKELRARMPLKYLLFDTWRLTRLHSSGSVFVD